MTLHDRRGFGLVVGCYVRAIPREPRKPYKGWVSAIQIEAPPSLGLVTVENKRGHFEALGPDQVEVLKPSLKARAKRARMRDLVHAVSARAHAGRRGL